jgi:predicted Zn-ribbon and HTH transcriptional regulator
MFGYIAVMDSPVILITCGHSFDEKQIREWLKKSPNCPMCKKESNETYIGKNYALVEAIDLYKARV